MQIPATTPEQYIELIPEDRKEVFNTLRTTIKQALPNGFEEIIQYGMISYVVPHSMYPDGYHCNPKDPLPFLAIASQKNAISFYHMGIYADENLLNWFVAEYPKQCKTKLDMGKSCIRFKKLNDIPFQLLSELVQKMNPNDWISLYESQFKRK